MKTKPELFDAIISKPDSIISSKLSRQLTDFDTQPSETDETLSLTRTERLKEVTALKMIKNYSHFFITLS